MRVTFKTKSLAEDMDNLTRELSRLPRPVLRAMARARDWLPYKYGDLKPGRRDKV